MSEFALVGLGLRQSTRVKPPQIAQSPVSLECVLQTTVSTGPAPEIVIGRVLDMHIADRFVLDAERGHIDTPALGLVARMHGKGWYARTSDLFHLDEPSYSDWLAAHPAEPHAG